MLRAGACLRSGHWSHPQPGPPGPVTSLTFTHGVLSGTSSNLCCWTSVLSAPCDPPRAQARGEEGVLLGAAAPHSRFPQSEGLDSLPESRSRPAQLTPSHKAQRASARKCCKSPRSQFTFRLRSGKFDFLPRTGNTLALASKHTYCPSSLECSRSNQSRGREGTEVGP